MGQEEPKPPQGFKKEQSSEFKTHKEYNEVRIYGQIYRPGSQIRVIESIPGIEMGSVHKITKIVDADGGGRAKYKFYFGDVENQYVFDFEVEPYSPDTVRMTMPIEERSAPRPSPEPLFNPLPLELIDITEVAKEKIGGMTRKEAGIKKLMNETLIAGEERAMQLRQETREKLQKDLREIGFKSFIIDRMSDRVCNFLYRKNREELTVDDLYYGLYRNGNALKESTDEVIFFEPKQFDGAALFSSNGFCLVPENGGGNTKTASYRLINPQGNQEAEGLNYKDGKDLLINLAKRYNVARFKEFKTVRHADVLDSGNELVNNNSAWGKIINLERQLQELKEEDELSEKKIEAAEEFNKLAKRRLDTEEDEDYFPFWSSLGESLGIVDGSAKREAKRIARQHNIYEKTLGEKPKENERGESLQDNAETKKKKIEELEEQCEKAEREERELRKKFNSLKNLSKSIITLGRSDRKMSKRIDELYSEGQRLRDEISRIQNGD